MSNRILVATRKGLFTIDRNGSGNWQIERVSFLGDPVTAVLSDERDNSLYAALNLGHFGVKMHRSDNGGESWQACATPAYPKQSEEELAAPGAKKQSLTQVWILEAGGKDDAGTIWAGTNPGGLFQSRDQGASWQLNTSLWQRTERAEWFGGGFGEPGIHSICVDPRDSKKITLGISCGGVWQSDDGGANWQLRAKGMRAAFMPPERAMDENIQDPHRVVQSPSNPEVFWAQHHNGIFRSGDGCASWQEITDVEPSVFGFAVAVHPHNPDVAYFVPAVKEEGRVPVNHQLVVTRTQDGGKSFQSLRNGLPQTHAYDLIYRHGLDIDKSGARLAIGSTTGSLWISEDGGAQWQNLSANLPPIYAVRFAEKQ